MLSRAKRDPNPKKIRNTWNVGKVPVSVCLAVCVCVCVRGGVRACVPVCVKIDGPCLDLAPGNLQEAAKLMLWGSLIIHN